MATIITVHGTGAKDSEFGSRWWQRGSPFESHIRELVESKDGTLTFEPFIWDGKNSETSRRREGSQLLARMKQLEANAEPYCVVGHSHGGSVSAHALLVSASKSDQLPWLRRWITIGTPFIIFSRSKSLFAKLNTVGKALYITLLTSCFLVGLVVNFVFFNIFGVNEIKVPIWQATLTYCMVGIILFVPFIAFYFIARGLLARRFAMYGPKQLYYAQQAFSSRWVSLCHKNDEAVQGLVSARSLKPSIFSSDFAVAPLVFVSIFILPLVIVILSNLESLTLAILNQFPERNASAIKYFQNNKGDYFAADIVFFATAVLGSLDYTIESMIKKVGIAGNYSFFLTFLVFPALLFIISFLIIHLAQIIAQTTSGILSKVLNLMTWQQIRNTMFGGDMLGEHATGAQNCPAWINTNFGFLPDALGDEINKISNESAAKAVAKFRKALDATVFKDSHAGVFSAFSEYVSWDELIHTSYFSVPRFRKLVAYSISTAEGFQATERYRNDSDYALVEKWFREIRGMKNEAFEGAASVPIGHEAQTAGAPKGDQAA